ncbi:MAG TPA: inositol monophosphatase family protein [Spirochaetota bacterium]|nr:inositol monophosphatase family protein [Spirochaetota bacterium]
MKELRDFAADIALKAGALLMEGFRSRSTVISYKSRTDLVTNRDRESEALLFGAVRKRFPGHTIVAEEGSRSDSGGDLAWFIDPLDATNNYAHGLPFFCVSIGVFSRSAGKVVAGVVYDPVHEEMFSAWQGGGAWLNEAPIRVSATGDIGISLLATGFPYDRQNPEKSNITQFGMMSPRVQGIRRLGSAALDLCYTACGRFDGYWEPELKPWDMAAGAVIVEEAGGRVTSYDGGSFHPEFPEIVASNGLIHDEMLATLTR